MRLTWFDLTEVLTFASRFVEDLHRAKTGGTARGDKMAQTVKRIEKLLAQSAEFEKTQRLNVYQKAKFLSEVRTGLTDKGWARADTETVINQMLTSRLRGRQSNI